MGWSQFWIVLGLLSVSTSRAQVALAVTTRAYDDARSGTTAGETTLTQAAVAARGMVRQTTIPVSGDARGMEAWPLVLPGVKVADGSTHDVMVLPSMANVVRGVDAETGMGLWSTTLGVPINGSAQIDFHQINQHWGCLSTGVLDADTQRLYEVCWTSQDGSGMPASGQYMLFVLDVGTGAQVGAAVPVQGSDGSMWKQRSSLAMTNVGGVKTIFFAHGSIYETATGFTGGITAFDMATNAVAAQLPLPEGIWMGGQGLIADAAGTLYALTANGDFDPARGWFGESFIKVRYTPKSGGRAASLKVVDQWSPWTDYGRAGQALPAAKMAGVSLPSETVKPVGGKMSMSLQGARVTASVNERGQVVALVYPPATGAWSDEDWGSAGPACLFSVGVCVATGKDGIGYPIKTANLGGTTKATVGTAANYAKLAAPCAWLTVSPGPVACAPANPTALNFFPWGNTAHLHMTPVQMYDPLLKSWVIFVWGENGQLHKWAVGSTGALTYVAQGREYASTEVRGNAPGGMPGGFCSGSSNGAGAAAAQGSMLLVCSIPYGDANATVTQGRLLVYDPVHLAADGSLKVLWDSQQWGVPYVFNKFMPPLIWNGRVYLPNYNGGVEVFGLGG